MPSSTIETTYPEDSITNQKQHNERTTPQIGSLRSYVLAGFAAVALLSSIEWVDLNIKLTPIFESFSERLVLTSYFSLNLVGGAIVGLIAGLVALLGSSLNKRLKRLIAPDRRQTAAQTLLVGLVIAAFAGGLVYFQPGVFRFTLGAIREAEKISLARLLLKAERLFTYFSITGMLICCWAVWRLARAAMNKFLRTAWLALIVGIISAAYYIDSRIEVQQYEFSLHRSMFLVEVTLAMAFVVSARGLFARQLRSPNRIALSCVAVLVLAGTGFTFVHFDRNQNLKTQVFYRSTITKQFFKLTQWALDLDRDGYSAVLGGGDADDRRA